MFIRKKIIALMLSLLAVTTIVGCNSSNNDNGSNSGTKDGEDITLQVYDRIFTEEQYNKYVLEPVQKKFPNIKLERVQGGNFEQLQNFVTTGTLPDIFLRFVAGTAEMTTLSIPQDLTDLIKKHNLNIDQYEPSIVESIQRYGQLTNNEPYDYIALPLYSQFQVLIYNTDIFDLFAESYPEDGMTYPEFYEIAKRLTREQDGVQYFGTTFSLSEMIWQLSLGLVDPETNRSLVNQLDEYKEIFKLGQSFYDIEGVWENRSLIKNIKKSFYADRIVAMFPTWVADMIKYLGPIEEQAFQWDLSTVPVFENRPDAHSMIDFHAMYLSQTSKHKDVAFQVMQYLSTGKEPQTILAREGKQTVLIDESIREQFGADLSYFEGKNMSVFEKTKTVPVSIKTGFDSIARSVLSEAFNQVISGEKDVNSALNEADEKINQLIDAELGR